MDNNKCDICLITEQRKRSKRRCEGIEEITRSRERDHCENGIGEDRVRSRIRRSNGVRERRLECCFRRHSQEHSESEIGSKRLRDSIRAQSISSGSDRGIAASCLAKVDLREFELGEYWR